MENNSEQLMNQPGPLYDYTGLSILKMYGEDLTAKQYITNPAIAR